MAWIGVDAGTSMVKAVRTDDDLVAEAVATAVVPVDRPVTGASEQDMHAVARAVEQVVARVAPPDGRVDGVAVTAQGDGCWLVGSDGVPTGPAVLWNDGRAGDVVARWEADGLLREAFEVTGSYGNAGLAHAELAWLRQHQPDRVRDARRLLSCGSWLFHELTDVAVLDVSDACNPFLRADDGTVAHDLLAAMGVGWTADLLPPVVSGADRVRPLAARAAAATGLRAGTPVVLAPYDVVATAAGVGAAAPGQGVAVLGTTLCVETLVTGTGLPRPPAGMSLATGVPGERLLAYATLAGTQVLDWWGRLLGVDGAAGLVALAASATRTDGPLLLPYLSPAGERAPFRDPAARGALVGVDLEHSPADVAAAVLRGLTLAVRDCLEASGTAPEVLAVCGGGSRSDLWCAMLADALQVPVTRPGSEQVGALGAVLTGLVAVGVEPDLRTACATRLRPGRTFAPDPVAAGRWDADLARLLAARASGAHRA